MLILHHLFTFTTERQQSLQRTAQDEWPQSYVPARSMVDLTSGIRFPRRYVDRTGLMAPGTTVTLLWMGYGASRHIRGNLRLLPTNGLLVWNVRFSVAHNTPPQTQTFSSALRIPGSSPIWNCLNMNAGANADGNITTSDESR
jgi:hypothetical protein